MYSGKDKKSTKVVLRLSRCIIGVVEGKRKKKLKGDAVGERRNEVDDLG